MQLCEKELYLGANIYAEKSNDLCEIGLKGMGRQILKPLDQLFLVLFWQKSSFDYFLIFTNNIQIRTPKRLKAFLNKSIFLKKYRKRCLKTNRSIVY